MKTPTRSWTTTQNRMPPSFESPRLAAMKTQIAHRSPKHKSVQPISASRLLVFRIAPAVSVASIQIVANPAGIVSFPILAMNKANVCAYRSVRDASAVQIQSALSLPVALAMRIMNATPTASVSVYHNAATEYAGQIRFVAIPVGPAPTPTLVMLKVNVCV